MENNKYYVPDITEFHVGFEFEYHYKSGDLMKHPSNTFGWKPDVYDWSWADILYDDYEHLPEEVPNRVRVKYLDRSDIEELGFEEVENTDIFASKGDCKFTINKHIHLLTSFDIKSSGIPVIIYQDDILRTQDKTGIFKRIDMFVGLVKNKSELKKILKMIGV